MKKLLPLIVVLLAVSGAQSALGGTPGPLSANPDPINFHTIAVGDSPTITVTITNDGPNDVTISDIGVSGGNGQLSASGCGQLPTTLTATTGTCDIDVTYTPSPNNQLDPGASLDITDDDPSDPQQHFSINGSSVDNRFHITSAPSPGFGTVAVGDTSNAKELTLTNQTDFSANPNRDVTGPDAGDFAVTGCGSNVNGGDVCVASVTFSPSSQGPESATLHFDGDSITFTGTGAQPVDVSPPALPFGDQHVGTSSAAQPITVTNNHDGAITVNVGTAADYNVNDSDCTNQPLQGHAQCTILVAFSPNAVGTQNGTLTVEGHNVQLTGRGTAAVANVQPPSISFGNQPVFTQSASHTVTVTNDGNEGMNIGVPALAGPNAAEFAISDTCQAAAPLPPNGQCTIAVTFNPTVRGPLDAELQFNSDSSNGQRTVQLHGTGTPSAVVFRPGPVEFTQPRHAGTLSTPKTITLTNRTNGALTIAKVHLGGSNPNSFRITGGNCGGRTLAADVSCTETVRFAPNEVGVKAASLIVNDDGPNRPHSVALTARATYPADDAAVRGAAGCDATKITWKKGGTSSRFDRTVIVRSRTHVPTGPGDGTRLPHGAGVLHDRGLSHFTAYQYRVFALYRSRTRPGTLNHSRGVVLRLRTGEICTPMDGGVITDTTPTVSWLRHSTLFGYSFLLFHGGDQVAQKRSVNSRSYTFPSRRHLHRGFTYTLFLYAYPPSQPEGTSIGRTTFHVR
jgi:Abnormal spindle-like microcephaly-assoc'd, ASPM-SPD-2-Hydin